MTFRISSFDHCHEFSLSQPQRKTFLSHWHHDLTKPKLLFYRDRVIERQTGNCGYLWSMLDTPTDITPTPGSVLINEDVIGSWFPSSVTTLIPSTCTWITSFPTSEDVAHKPTIHIPCYNITSFRLCSEVQIKKYFILYKYVPANPCTMKDVDWSFLLSEIAGSNFSDGKVIRQMCLFCVV